MFKEVSKEEFDTYLANNEVTLQNTIGFCTPSQTYYWFIPRYEGADWAFGKDCSWQHVMLLHY